MNFRQSLFWDVDPKTLNIKKHAVYISVAHDYHHILKSLVYFADAENDPTPKLNFNANWRQVKKIFYKRSS